MQELVEEALAVKLERREAAAEEEALREQGVAEAEKRVQQKLEQLRKADR